MMKTALYWSGVISTEMSDNVSGSSTSSEAMLWREHPQRGKKRQRDSQASSTDNRSKANNAKANDNPKDGTVIKSSSWPQMPRAPAEAVGDEAPKVASPEEGMSGPSYPKRNENEIDNKRPTSPIKEISSPSRTPKCKEPRNRVVKSKSACKEPCNCARCRGRHIRRADIVMNHMRRYPPKVGATWLTNSIIFPRPNQLRYGTKLLQGDNNLEIGKREAVEKPRINETSGSEGKAQSDRDSSRKRKKAGEETAVTNAKESNGKSQGEDSKEECSKGSNLKRRENAKSCESKLTCSGRSSGRSSVRSVETLDGHSEFLASLEHAAIAEENLLEEKKVMQKEVKKLERENDKLAEELAFALKVVDKLKQKTQCLYKEKKDIVKQKAELEKELKGTTKEQQAKEREKLSQSQQQKSECSICFEELKGSSSSKKNGHKTGGKSNLKQRACFRPCNHAGACVPCAVSIWEKTNKCPFCDTKLSGKPAAIHF